MAIEGTTGSQTCSREMTSSRAEKDNTDNKTETKTAAVAARGSTDTLSPGQDNKDNNEASHATLSILLIYCCCVFLRPCLLTKRCFSFNVVICLSASPCHAIQFICCWPSLASCSARLQPVRLVKLVS